MDRWNLDCVFPGAEIAAFQDLETLTIATNSELSVRAHTLVPRVCDSHVIFTPRLRSPPAPGSHTAMYDNNEVITSWNFALGVADSQCSRLESRRCCSAIRVPISSPEWHTGFITQSH